MWQGRAEDHPGTSNNLIKIEYSASSHFYSRDNSDNMSIRSQSQVRVHEVSGTLNRIAFIVLKVPGKYACVRERGSEGVRETYDHI